MAPSGTKTAKSKEIKSHSKDLKTLGEAFRVTTKAKGIATIKGLKIADINQDKKLKIPRDKVNSLNITPLSDGDRHHLVFLCSRKFFKPSKMAMATFWRKFSSRRRSFSWELVT